MGQNKKVTKSSFSYNCQSHKCLGQRRFYKIAAEHGDALVIQCVTCGHRTETTKKHRATKRLKKIAYFTPPRVAEEAELGDHPDTVTTEQKSFSVGDVRKLILIVNQVFNRTKLEDDVMKKWNDHQVSLKHAAVSSFGIKGVLFSELPDSIALNVAACTLLEGVCEWLALQNRRFENIVLS